MSKRQSPLWMPLYVSKFLADTARLTAAQRGAYISMLCEMWRSKDGTLPNDPDVLAGASGVGPNNWARVWKGIKSLFDIDNERVTSTDLQAELGKANAKIVMKRAAAALGGITTTLRKSWGNAKTTTTKSTPEKSLVKSLNALNPLKTNDAAQAYAQASATHNHNRDIKKEEEREGSTRPGTVEPSLEEEKKGFQEEQISAPCKPLTTSPSEKPDPKLAALDNWGAALYEKRRKR